jgi:rsbT co-antagonist protein RsbR
MTTNGQTTQVLQDEIASLRQEVENLRQSQTLLRGIIDAVPAGVVAKDVEGRYIFANASAAASIKQAPEEIIGKTDADILPADEAAAAAEREQHVIQTGQPLEREISMTLADGPHTLLATQFPLFDEQGNLVAICGLGTDISERKQQENQLRMTQFSLDRAADMVLWHRLDGSIVYVNEATCRNFGYTQDELYERTVLDLDPNFTLDTAQALWTQINAQGYLTIETSHRRKDGSTFPSEVTINALDFDGQEYLCVFARDISERKRQESELRMFKALVENALDSIAVVRADTGEIVYINNAYRHMYRCGDEHIGQSIAVVVAEEDQQQLPEVLEAIATEGAWAGMLTHVRQDGETFTASETCFVIRDEDNNIQYMVGAVRDVSDQKRQENELRVFKTMADTAPDGFGMANADGTLIYANAAYRDMTGYGDALVGMNFMDHFSDEERPIALEALQSTAQQGSWRGTFTFLRRDGGSVPIEATGFVTRDDAGTINAVIGLFRDLTEQRRIEAERQSLQEQVIDAQRAALRELSTPLIPVSDNVVIMPLIGTIDTGRAQQVMETLLEGVAHYQSSLAILDITGVSVVDTQVAQALIGAAQAVKLLGAQVMLTGIQPQIAQTLVHLGVDLSGIETRGSLQSGIAHALRDMNKRR